MDMISTGTFNNHIRLMASNNGYLLLNKSMYLLIPEIVKLGIRIPLHTFKKIETISSCYIHW